MRKCAGLAIMLGVLNDSAGSEWPRNRCYSDFLSRLQQQEWLDSYFLYSLLGDDSFSGSTPRPE